MLFIAAKITMVKRRIGCDRDRENSRVSLRHGDVSIIQRRFKKIACVFVRVALTM